MMRPLLHAARAAASISTRRAFATTATTATTGRPFRVLGLQQIALSDLCVLDRSGPPHEATWHVSGGGQTPDQVATDKARAARYKNVRHTPSPPARYVG